MEDVQLRRFFSKHSREGEFLHRSFPVIIHRRSDGDVLGPAVVIGRLNVEKLVILGSKGRSEPQVDVEQSRRRLGLRVHCDGYCGRVQEWQVEAFRIG
jgi:hypothetical protein